MIYKNKEEKIKIPLLEIIKKKYGLLNVFLLFSSMFFMGLANTLKYLYASSINNKNKILFSFSFFLFTLFFIYSVFPLIKTILKEIYLISWLSYKQIFLKILQVFCFTFILEFIIYFFSFLYDKLDPILI
jgi:hypothetical protein